MKRVHEGNTLNYQGKAHHKTPTPPFSLENPDLYPDAAEDIAVKILPGCSFRLSSRRSIPVMDQSAENWSDPSGREEIDPIFSDFF